jgi:uncharacterized protein with PIN domain
MAPELSFMIDHMLIGLGKYLRILGYDAAWDSSVRTHELIHRANADGRIFVTRNTKLPDQYPAPNRLVTVAATDPVEQLEALVAELGLDDKSYLFSRCIRCNVELREIEDRKTVEPRVHPNVCARYEKFYSCPSCDTVFWKGTHVTNTLRKLGRGGEC